MIVQPVGAAASLSLESVHAMVAPIVPYLRVEIAPTDREGWLDRAALIQPDAEGMIPVNTLFTDAGFGANRRALAASILLRHGWAAGFTIATWLSCGLIVKIDDFALRFAPQTALAGLWVKSATIETPGDAQTGRACLIAEMRRFTEDVLAAQQIWSRFSRHALWAMVTSSWAAQFAAIGERLGRQEEAVEEARLLLALDAETAEASPEIYAVDGEEGRVMCQRRAACCLYFKGPKRHFCASCPIVPAPERLARNQAWADLPTHQRHAG